MTPECTAPKRGHKGNTSKALRCPKCGPKTRKEIHERSLAGLLPPPAGSTSRSSTAPLNMGQGVKPKFHNVGQVCHVKDDIYGRKGKERVFEDWSDTSFERVVIPEGSPDFRFTTGVRISMFDCVSHVGVQLGEDAQVVGGVFHDTLIVEEGHVDGARVREYVGINSEADGLRADRAEIDGGRAEIVGDHANGYPFVLAVRSAYVSMRCPGVVVLEDAAVLSAQDPSVVVVKRASKYGFLDMSSRTRINLATRPKDNSKGMWLDARNEAAWDFIVNADGLSSGGDSKAFEVDEGTLALALQLHENPA